MIALIIIGWLVIGFISMLGNAWTEAYIEKSSINKRLKLYEVIVFSLLGPLCFISFLVYLIWMLCIINKKFKQPIFKKDKK